MLSVALLIALSINREQDSAVIRFVEPERPEFVSTDFEVRCRGRKLSLMGISGGGVRFEHPIIDFNGQKLDLSSDLRSFLRAESATYRMSATCPNTVQSVQLRIYRAEAILGAPVTFIVRALNIEEDGQIIDRGSEQSTSEAFWFR